MFDFDKFCEDFLNSQKEGELSSYCEQYWSEAVAFVGNDPFHIDILIGLSANEEAYFKYVEQLKVENLER